MAPRGRSEKLSACLLRQVSTHACRRGILVGRRRRFRCRVCTSQYQDRSLLRSLQRSVVNQTSLSNLSGGRKSVCASARTSLVIQPLQPQTQQLARDGVQVTTGTGET